MLRVRALASSSRLLTGEYGVVSTSISVKPELVLFNGNGHTNRWNAETAHFMNSFCTKSIFPKLMTQKMDPLMKNSRAREPSSRTSCPPKSSTYLKSNPLKQEAASTSRTISNASMRNVPNQFEPSDEEFEEVTESSRSTISNGGPTVTGIHHPNCPTNASDTVTIRISNINTKTADAMIHSICKSVGPLEGLTRKNASEVEAFFILKNNLDSQGILAQLDNKIVEKCQWSACIFSIEDSEDDCRLKQGEQISSSIIDLKKQIVKEFLTKKLLLEDLENLHASLVHLENHPNKMDFQPIID